jgi:hypothetical protein
LQLYYDDFEYQSDIELDKLAMEDVLHKLCFEPKYRLLATCFKTSAFSYRQLRGLREDRKVGRIVYGAREDRIGVIGGIESYLKRIGIGRMILDHAETVMKLRGVKIIYLHSVDQSVPFWLRMGYYLLEPPIPVKYISMGKSIG